jgi:hypothetical protein
MASKSKRFALIIGNSEYQDSNLSKLTSPTADVKDFAYILEKPQIGDFELVITLINKPADVVRRAIAEFFSNRERDDLLLIYFSGHGLLDKTGHLYLAVKDTEINLLRATAIAASYVSDEIDESYSKRKVVMLDCCHSGAFSRGKKGKTGETVGTGMAFKGDGYGRVILTATDAIQYAFEGNTAIGKTHYSLFTHYLIEGLETGLADLDNDGHITIDELYDYVFAKTKEANTGQTPHKWSYGQEGRIVIARNPSPQAKIGSLPPELVSAIKNPFAKVRESVVGVLDEFLAESNNSPSDFIEAALIALEILSKDGNDNVSTFAYRVIEKHRNKPMIPEVEKEKSIVSSKISHGNSAAFERARISIQSITCKRCGTLRSLDLKEPCPLCGSRKYPALGYTYAHEARQLYTSFLVLMSVIAGILLLGTVFWLYFTKP